jgi:ferredoxin-type protein NapF
MSVDPNFSASRRAFLKLPSEPETKVIRPPWTDEQSVSAHCTGCRSCVEACPQSILRMDDSARPAVSFEGQECTFCEKCAQACDEPVFDLTRALAFELKAKIETGCLQDHGISCQSCRDTCPQSAIRVDLTKRPFGRLKVDEEACTGCGACLGVCPQDVISLAAPPPATEAA